MLTLLTWMWTDKYNRISCQWNNIFVFVNCDRAYLSQLISSQRSFGGFFLQKSCRRWITKVQCLQFCELNNKKKSIWHSNWCQSILTVVFLSSKLVQVHQGQGVQYIIHHTHAKWVVAQIVWRSLKGDCVNSGTVTYWRVLCFCFVTNTHVNYPRDLSIWFGDLRLNDESMKNQRRRWFRLSVKFRTSWFYQLPPTVPTPVQSIGNSWVIKREIDRKKFIPIHETDYGR